MSKLLIAFTEILTQKIDFCNEKLTSNKDCFY